MIDYLIVGSGLAGIAFAEKALQNDKSILVFDDDSQNSSKIAAGLYNPVILKRFSGIFQAQEQLDQMQQFYLDVEAKLQSKFNYKIPILRKFFSVEEQNNWFLASDKQDLAPFLSTNIIAKKYNGIDAPFGYGKVLQTGYVNTGILLSAYKDYLKSNYQLIQETFEHAILEINSQSVSYKNIEAKHIVFAEGFGMHANLFFNHLPLDGTKGELFVIKAPDLGLDVIVNTNVFILPLGNGLFKVGATYNWEDKTDRPTAAGKTELTERIKEIITCDFEIIEHLAGVRPTVKDRKPMIGTHHIHKNLHILNGLGTRGVMLGPAMASELFRHIEYQNPLQKETDIKRFKIF
jgi:glycine/D-amino acid oxidase-like deaminating enzyme